MINEFEAILQKSYNIEHAEAGWFRFSKGRGVFQGGVRGDQLRIAQELFSLDPSSLEHLDKDVKKASKALIGGCFVEEEGGSLWVVSSIPLAQASQTAIKDMFDNCSIASRSKAVKKLDTQHKKTITINKPR